MSLYIKKYEIKFYKTRKRKKLFYPIHENGKEVKKIERARLTIGEFLAFVALKNDSNIESINKILLANALYLLIF